MKQFRYKFLFQNGSTFSVVARSVDEAEKMLNEPVKLLSISCDNNNNIMRIITIEMYVSTNKYVGPEVTEEFFFEVGDDATQEEIENEANEVTREWMFENINWGFEIKRDEKQNDEE